MENIINEIGIILIYIFAFGLSDLFVKKYCKNDKIYITYYIIIGLIGYYLSSSV
tara:strand:- start:240 stop:401 length:162 start_codon:yes stop_codon:yes gene_type:complete